MLQKRRLHVASSILKHKTPSIEVVSLWIQIPGAGCLECPRLCDDYGSIDTIQAGQCRSNRMDPKRWMKWFIRHYPTSHYKNHTFLTIKIIYYWAQNIHCVGRKGGKRTDEFKEKWLFLESCCISSSVAPTQCQNNSWQIISPHHISRSITIFQ